MQAFSVKIFNKNLSTWKSFRYSSTVLGGLERHNYKRPMQNTPFCPISTSGSNFNPQNTQCIPMVKIFPFLELEQK
jgi:hypothetical protein